MQERGDGHLHHPLVLRHTSGNEIAVRKEGVHTAIIGVGQEIRNLLIDLMKDIQIMSYIYLRSKERGEGTIPLLEQGCIAVDGIQFGIGVAALEDNDNPLGSADVLIDTHRLLLRRRER